MELPKALAAARVWPVNVRENAMRCQQTAWLTKLVML